MIAAPSWFWWLLKTWIEDLPKILRLPRKCQKRAVANSSWWSCRGLSWIQKWQEDLTFYMCGILFFFCGGNNWISSLPVPFCFFKMEPSSVPLLAWYFVAAQTSVNPVLAFCRGDVVHFLLVRLRLSISFEICFCRCLPLKKMEDNFCVWFLGWKWLYFEMIFICASSLEIRMILLLTKVIANHMVQLLGNSC